MGVTVARAQSQTNHWALRCCFCMTLQDDPLLLDQEDPIPLLQLFARQYRTGDMFASGSLTKKCQVEQVLHSIGQTLASMGLPDPHLAPFSTKLKFCLQCQLTRYQKMDPPPSKSKADSFTYATICNGHGLHSTFSCSQCSC